MKKFFKIVTLLCVITAMGLGSVSTSLAYSASALDKDFPPSSSLVEIMPFASPVITGISYSITSSSVWALTMLNKSYSGTVTVIIQKQNGSSWGTHTTICSSDSFSGSSIYKAGSYSLESGTYRISVTVTTGGSSYTSTTGTVKIS